MAIPFLKELRTHMNEFQEAINNKEWMLLIFYCVLTLGIAVGFVLGLITLWHSAFPPTETIPTVASSPAIPYSDESQLSPLPPYPAENPYANLPPTTVNYVGTELTPKVTCGAHSITCSGVTVNGSMIIGGN